MCPVGWVLGVDVSVWQGDIDWPALYATLAAGSDGRPFAFVRYGDGSYVDEMFWTNMAGARAAGFLVGSYQFVRDGWESPEGQMGRWADAVDQAGGVDLPLAIDYEHTAGGGVAGSTAEWARRAVDYLEQRYGRPPIVYTGYYFWQSSVQANVERAPLWLAAYTWGYDPFVGDPGNWATQAFARPAWDGIDGYWDRWHLWQFTSSGQLDGVGGNVDVNLATPADIAGLADLAPAAITLEDWMTSDEAAALLNNVAGLCAGLTNQVAALESRIKVLEGDVRDLGGWKVELIDHPDGTWRSALLGPNGQPQHGGIVATQLHALTAEAATFTRTDKQGRTFHARVAAAVAEEVGKLLELAPGSGQVVVGEPGAAIDPDDLAERVVAKLAGRLAS